MNNSFAWTSCQEAALALVKLVSDPGRAKHTRVPIGFPLCLGEESAAA